MRSRALPPPSPPALVEGEGTLGHPSGDEFRDSSPTPTPTPLLPWNGKRKWGGQGQRPAGVRFERSRTNLFLITHPPPPILKVLYLGEVLAPHRVLSRVTRRVNTRYPSCLCVRSQRSPPAEVPSQHGCKAWTTRSLRCLERGSWNPIVLGPREEGSGDLENDPQSSSQGSSGTWLKRAKPRASHAH